MRVCTNDATKDGYDGTSCKEWAVSGVGGSKCVCDAIELKVGTFNMSCSSSQHVKKYELK